MKLNDRYNQDSFIEFAQDFLPEDLKFREEDILIKPERYKEVKKAKVLGFCESLDLHVLEMDHTHNNDPRVTIATDAFKILADHWIHRALVIFKNNDSDNYRFSYLTISLDLNDKNKVVKKYSNARRYSFYLGTNAKVKTPEQQLIKKGRVKDVDDLFSRFSIEVVNKQFYLEVAKFFDELVSIEQKNLVLPGHAENDLNVRKSFAVRLIGRTMFCWFLKHKKSENGQLIPDEILSSQVSFENYYHNTLEPLFFGVLNTSIESRDIRSDLFDKVPYLNGGLFNPQHDDYYELDRFTFASKFINTLKINDVWFKEFFELLETYNFTIDENTIFDYELSVDPEMLGRIFENLLAEINPDTGGSERKRTGSFYTPRQIVEYMVDQSLIEYLKTKTGIEEHKLDALISYDQSDDADSPLDESEKKQIIDAIESLKILDPACGSGAYPIGVLQKIVYILQQIDPDCTKWLEKKLQGVPDLYKQKIINEVKQNPFDYTRKLDVIKNSIFGVDIQPIAVDVSRLRCFLTLVVESEIDDSKQNRGIEPLPNLDFKFVCANTLISLPKTENTGLFDDHFGIAELSKIMSEYFSCNNQRKTELKIRFTNTQKEILKKTVSVFGKNTGELTLKLTTWNPFSNQTNPWFDPEWMFGIEEKFDVVIGNPPYVGEKGNKDIFRNIKETPLGKRFHIGKMDLFYFFFHFGIDVLKDNGVLSFISTNYYVTATGAKKLIEDFHKRVTILRMINFGEMKIFESALGQHNMITVIQNGKHNINAKTVVTRRAGYLRNNDEVIQNILSNKDTETEYYSITQEDLYDANNIRLSVSNGGTNIYERILNKIQLDCVRLIDICRINLGCHITISKITNKHLADFKDFKKDEGVFVLNNNEIVGLGLTEIEKSKIKNFLKNSDISKYSANISSEKLVYTRWDDDIDLYPNIKNHLLKFKEILDDQGKRYNEPSWPWFSIHRPREVDLFETREKTLVPYRSKSNIFGYIEDPVYASGDVFFMILRSDARFSVKFLLGVLNSKLIYQWLYRRGKRKGEILELYQDPLSKIPIPKLESDQNIKNANKIEVIVNQIIGIKKLNQAADTNNLEKQVDELVMDLYQLTEEEKEVIRNS